MTYRASSHISHVKTFVPMSETTSAMTQDMTPLWLLFQINRAIIGRQFSNFPALIFCNESHPVRHHRMWRGVGKRFFAHFITLAVVETHWHRAEARPIERKVKLFLFSVGLRERTKEASLIKSHLLINFPIKIHASTIKMWIHMPWQQLSSDESSSIISTFSRARARARLETDSQ